MDELDPMQKLELALLRAEHQKEYALQISFVKEQIGEGLEYKNTVVRAVVSERGAYYEFNDLPEQFCGASSDEGDIASHFISVPDAVSRLTKAVAAIKRIRPENTRHFSLLVVYSRRGIIDQKSCFVYDYGNVRARSAGPSVEIGKFQPGVMPLFWKINMDADFAEEVIGLSEGGILFCMKNEGDRHLLVSIPYANRNLVNFTERPSSKTLN